MRLGARAANRTRPETIPNGVRHMPTDRIIDGIDQTALPLKGDTHGRRDYNFIYRGPDPAATAELVRAFDAYLESSDKRRDSKGSKKKSEHRARGTR